MEQFFAGCGDQDVFPAKLPDHLRGDLLVAASEKEPLTAGDRNNQPGLFSADRLEHLPPIEVIGEQLSVEDQVDADQGIFQAEQAHDPARGGACADQILHPRFHPADQFMGD